MRIISKFHDYYDSVQIHGQDPKLIYQRNTIEVPKNQHPFTFDMYYRTNNPDYFLVDNVRLDIDSCILGFCGKMYPVLTRYGYSESEAQYMYSVDETKHLQDLEEKKLFYHDYFEDRVQKFFAQKESSKFQETFIKFKVPCFLFFRTDYFTPITKKDIDSLKSTYKLILNPNLKGLKFQTIKDPFTAFQEIEQYLSGVLTIGNPETVIINDEEKIKKAGFDKWSFRKLPTKRKLHENK